MPAIPARTPSSHQTTLLLWSNYSDAQVDLGTIAAYDISPVMMNLYGLQQPLYFQFLNRQLRVASRACTRGVTMNLDGTTTLEPTEFQQRWTQEHWMLQYDLMFGKGYALTAWGWKAWQSPPKANKLKNRKLFWTNREKLLQTCTFCAMITRHYTRITMPFCALLGGGQSGAVRYGAGSRCAEAKQISGGILLWQSFL